MHVFDSITLAALAVAGVTLAGALVANLARHGAFPTPLVFLAGGVAASMFVPGAHHAMSVHTLAWIGSFALIAILFDGGMGGGLARTRAALRPILVLGLAGTLITTGLLSVSAHYLFGWAWQLSVLVGVALAPTDPAAVFSVLGSRDVPGASSAIVEGESGANDPVGITLMLAAVAYYAGHSSLAHVPVEFFAQLLIGATIGAIGGYILQRALPTLQFPVVALRAAATIAFALLVYGSATWLHGSGFLAVFVTGLFAGDVLPEGDGVRDFSGITAAVAEMVIFTCLGLAIVPSHFDSSTTLALGLFVLLTFVIRPAVVATLLARERLSRAERIFISWAGLKGAVPILLATFPALEHLSGHGQILEIVFVAVAASIGVQGFTVPRLVDKLGLSGIPETEAVDTA